jgi:transcriptional regulator NrdR family protein
MSLCPECLEDSKVLETRIDYRNWRVRRRVCVACGHRYWTYEIPLDQITIDEPAQAEVDDE